MRVDDPSMPEEQSATQMIENVLGDLEPKASNLAVAPLEASEDVKDEEVPTGRGHEASADKEGVHEVHPEDKDTGVAHLPLPQQQ